MFDATVAVIQAWPRRALSAPVDPPHLIFAIWAPDSALCRLRRAGGALSGKALSDKGFMDETLAAVIAPAPGDGSSGQGNSACGHAFVAAAGERPWWPR
ncbi:TetR family transcriptional regulator C-terminal domain-containing protein [Caulobacter segnis]